VILRRPGKWISNAFNASCQPGVPVPAVPPPVPRHIQIDRADVGEQPFRPRPVPAVPRPAARPVAPLIPEMISQFLIQSPLEDLLRQPRQHTVLPEELQTLRAHPRHQMINEISLHRRRLGHHRSVARRRTLSHYYRHNNPFARPSHREADHRGNPSYTAVPTRPGVELPKAGADLVHAIGGEHDRDRRSTMAIT